MHKSNLTTIWYRLGVICPDLSYCNHMLYSCIPARYHIFKLWLQTGQKTVLDSEFSSSVSRLGGGIKMRLDELPSHLSNDNHFAMHTARRRTLCSHKLLQLHSRCTRWMLNHVRCKLPFSARAREWLLRVCFGVVQINKVCDQSVNSISFFNLFQPRR